MNVGDYVRTDKGNISKIKWISQQVINSKETKAGTFHLENGEIVHMYYGDTIKSSPQIIDLIEVGDYVNGLRVEKNKYGELYTSYVYYGGDIGKQCEVYTNWVKEMQEENIYTIATHEQMEAMQYRVEE